MKKILSLILCFFMISSALISCRQEPGTIDITTGTTEAGTTVGGSEPNPPATTIIDIAKLEEGDHVISTEYYDTGAIKKEVLVHINQKNPKLNYRKTTYYRPDGTLQITYREDINLIGEGTLKSKSIFDTEGNLTTSYKYYENGSIEKSEVLNSDGTTTYTHYRENGNISSIEIEHEVNFRVNTLKLFWFDERGELVAATYYYDSGVTKEEIQYYPGASQILARTTYYDIKERMICNESFIYDENGNLTDYSKWDENGNRLA